ncbi:hypothetical protein ACA910_017225 [Epithemia clementina (nom. ined.)]
MDSVSSLGTFDNVYDKLITNPLLYMGCFVIKEFDEVQYKGQVVGYNPQNRWWRILFKDGDDEDFEVDDMIDGLELYRTWPEIIDLSKDLSNDKKG